MNVEVDEGGQPKNREDITVSTTPVPIAVSRTDGFPTIFAGFRANWFDVDGEHDGVALVADMASGAGFGSPYLTWSVTVGDNETVHEYVDMRDFFRERIEAIVAETRLKKGSSDD